MSLTKQRLSFVVAWDKVLSFSQSLRHLAIVCNANRLSNREADPWASLPNYNHSLADRRCHPGAVVLSIEGGVFSFFEAIAQAKVVQGFPILCQ